MQPKEELVAFLASLAEVAKQKEISPRSTVEILFDIMCRESQQCIFLSPPAWRLLQQE